MPFNGSGIFAYTATSVAPDAVAGTTISSADHDTFSADIATALTLCITKDGQTVSPLLTTPQINEAVTTTATSTELNILDDATLTTAELNILDGSATTQATVTLAGTDGVVISDADVMKQCLVSDFATYIRTVEQVSGSHTTGSISALTDAAAVDITHGLGTDDVDVEYSIFGGNASMAVAVFVSGVSVGVDRRLVSNHVNGSARVTVSAAPSSGDVRFYVRNGAGVAQTITIKYTISKRA